MDAEEVLQLFDSYWFDNEIFSKQPPPLPPPKAPAPEIQEEDEKPKMSRFPTLHTRSQSEQLLTSTESFNPDSPSPKSVLVSPRLQTIFSGKEVLEVADQGSKQEEETKIPSTNMISRRRRKKGHSKSLSDLEFEEIKGFMDLGFVFSEEDRNSSLVSILPGLQRLGKEEGEEEERVDESPISRPYLSEAWSVLDRRREEKFENRLMNWRIPASANENDMKNHLRSWAHTVASTVR